VSAYPVPGASPQIFRGGTTVYGIDSVGSVNVKIAGMPVLSIKGA
jgi:hypothetical protein